MSKKNIGKIVELELPSFIVYGVCTHSDGPKGEIIKLFKGTYQKRLSSQELKFDDQDYFTTIRFPLRYALKEPEVHIVGKAELSDAGKKRPIFRSLGLARAGEMPKGWWIIDGDKEHWVSALTSEMASYPDDGLYNLLAIQELYERDLYPDSLELLSRGPLAFDPTRV
ncbi:hypothetical protein SAMN04488030_0051 [Aliiroseovarius halocynthiae]|uniref:Uncharacterized protein n=1 Tax=Aliiroseovarius halocynthiae TaxID=985055 RepID=A0A545SL91_9RHOB|nr:hypothetical protein [Aliiroseovarius halocynthiae]TQV65750.1 hypothetical protein FIL88_16040 [Aliiroseovarius halocynthiae]SMR83574.1 hypothetical protein SAMN04488030_0051 [Aliiroseovarius halocynthiae]